MESPFGWPGGKRVLKNTLLKHMPKHDLYVEVFAGSAKLLFAKPPSTFEVINDLNGDVMNFFRVAKHRPAELAERFEIECIHSERFVELRKSSGIECEVDRALRFLYLTWYSFGSKGENFARPSATAPRMKHPILTVRSLLQATAARLSAVSLEQRDFADAIARYDSRRTFFYLDPPYVSFGSNGRYKALTPETRVALFDQLSTIRGRFLMSFDDHAEVRKLSKLHGFKTKKVEVVYTLNGSARSAQPELLISNYPLQPNV